MSKLSNRHGRAFEFAFLEALEDSISKIRSVEVLKDGGYDAAKNSWLAVDTRMQEELTVGSKAAIPLILEFEPLILEEGIDSLLLCIQTDSRGIEGDVRDILIIRKAANWEIGLSLKRNHFAVKHSRLSRALDFGKSWFGINCSNQYWQDVKPIFDFLEYEKRKNTLWRELEYKEDNVYIPLLYAFKDEILRIYNKWGESVPQKMVEYLLGKYDFYKIISVPSKDITYVQTFNIKGTLNKSSKDSKPRREIPRSSLPTRIISIDLKPGSSTTVELYMDRGWQFSFRIHNASKYVESSLKFDISIIGMPTTIITISCNW